MPVIRPSSLPGYNDCAKRVASNLFAADIALAGYELRKTTQGVGAAVGHALHAGIKKLHIVKRDHQRELRGIEVFEDAEAEFDKSTVDGVEFDTTTGNKMVAMKQVSEQLATYAAYVLPTLKPKLVEEKFREEIRDDLVFEGTIDLLTEDNVIHDAKFGSKLGAYNAQMGAYLRLLERGKPLREGVESGIKIAGLVVDWVRRTPKTKAPADPLPVPYPMKPAYGQAKETIQRMVSDYDRFKATNDPYAFPMNPSTFLCSKKYCSAHGTKWCDQWKEDKDE